MKADKQKKLEAAGWKVGSTAEFLELDTAEEMLVNMKLAMAAEVKSLRTQSGITQQDLAKRLRSSQSRVAKIESADRTVSFDLLIRTLAELGATRSQIGKIVGSRKGSPQKPGRRTRKPLSGQKQS